MATCKTCGASIIWAAHCQTQKQAPLDAIQSVKGNCLTFDSDGKLYYSIPPKAELPELQIAGKLRTNHWMTCSRPPARKGGKAE